MAEFQTPSMEQEKGNASLYFIAPFLIILYFVYLYKWKLKWFAGIICSAHNSFHIGINFVNMYINNLAILSLSVLIKKEEERLFVPVTSYSEGLRIWCWIFAGTFNLRIKIRQSSVLIVLPSCFWDWHVSDHIYMWGIITCLYFTIKVLRGSTVCSAFPKRRF